MKKYLFFVVFVLTCLLTIFSTARDSSKYPPPVDKVESFVIFGPKTSVDIAYASCNSDNAEQDVWVKDKAINWEWTNKRNSWCGWGVQELPRNDFSKFEGYKLEIRLSGSWSDKKAPQIKFMDSRDKATKLLRISQGSLIGNPNSTEGAVYTIPLSKFKMDKTIDSADVKTLQFDAAYESKKGEIKIYSIKIVR